MKLRKPEVFVMEMPPVLYNPFGLSASKGSKYVSMPGSCIAHTAGLGFSSDTRRALTESKTCFIALPSLQAIQGIVNCQVNGFSVVGDMHDPVIFFPVGIFFCGRARIEVP